MVGFVLLHKSCINEMGSTCIHSLPSVMHSVGFPVLHFLMTPSLLVISLIFLPAFGGTSPLFRSKPSFRLSSHRRLQSRSRNRSAIRISSDHRRRRCRRRPMEPADNPLTQHTRCTQKHEVGDIGSIVIPFRHQVDVKLHHPLPNPTSACAS